MSRKNAIENSNVDSVSKSWDASWDIHEKKGPSCLSHSLVIVRCGLGAAGHARHFAVVALDTMEDVCMIIDRKREGSQEKHGLGLVLADERRDKCPYKRLSVVLSFVLLMAFAGMARAQLIVPKEVQATVPPAVSAPPSPVPVPSLSSRDSRDFVGEWTGKWTNSRGSMMFLLKIGEGKENKLAAEGKASTWTLTEVFEGSVSGDAITLTGTHVLPTPSPGKYYCLDVLSLTLSQDGKRLSGTWVDKENSRGTIEVDLKTPPAPSSAAPGNAAPDLTRGVEADANDAIKTAFRTGSTKEFLSRAVPTQLAMWQTAAEKEIPEALWLLGCCYDNGVGVGSDPSRALQYYLRAAGRDYGPALNDVGLCYGRGIGVAKDLMKAVEYYKRAAEKGRPGAWFNLGSCYEQGLGGLPKDINEAVSCYRKAKDLGYGPAEKTLARLGR